MEPCYLAVDIGASSGRHILGWLEDGKLRLQEIYRFQNGLQGVEGHRCWDLSALFAEILNGLRVCKTLGRIPTTLGIDTWAVDYVLLDEGDEVLGRTYAYRDDRTAGMDEKVYACIPQDALYARTGIQKQPFNTIYQLMASREQEPALFARARTLLMVPDYFNFLLTGVKKSEYTNATTTQLVSPVTKDWDRELIGLLGYPQELFLPLTLAGTPVGHLKPELAQELGFDPLVMQTTTHDTASAVLAVPARGEDFLYISSGTWSLMGVEQQEANCTRAAQMANFTNEGGYDYRFRFLKNIMGLWMIQNVQKELETAYSFGELCRLAEEAGDFPARVDVNDARFLAPDSMIDTLRAVCAQGGMPVPQTPGELAAVVYQSLAESYGQTVQEIEALTGKTYDAIHIVGGGANAAYLNRLTANATGKTVYSGPTEATAIGNLAVQLLRAGEFADVSQAREVIFSSFAVQTFEPNNL